MVIKMKFVFYKVASIIRENLKISYSFKDKDLENKSLGTKSLFAALFITPPKLENGKYEEISEDNFDEIIKSIGSISNCKSYMSGNRAIPKSVIKEYADLEELPSALMRIRYRFFLDMINSEGEIIRTLDRLKRLIKSSNNINEAFKSNLLSSDDDIFYNLLKDEKKNDYNTECIEIFKILIYSLRYSEEKTEFDDLECVSRVHPFYVERDDIIKNICDSFEKHNNVYLCGIRGSGKTEIVNKYISENKFYGVITISYENDLMETLKRENCFNFKEFSIEKTQKAFSQMDDNYLLVIENVTEQIENDWLEFIKQCGCKVLIVTSWKPNSDYSIVVDVTKLNESQAISMINNYVRSEGRFTDKQKFTIAKKLNYHALAITVYAKAIEQSSLEYDEIISILDKSLVSHEIEEKVTLKENDEELACEHIRALFMKTFDALISDDAKNVLMVMSLVPSKGIPLNSLQMYADLKNNNVINLELKPLLWLEVGRDTNRTVTIHSIIRDIVIDKLKPDINNCKKFVETICNEIGMFWSYSYDGILYQEFYFSILKRIIFVPSINLTEFEFVIKGISSLVNYGYKAEAKLIYEKAMGFLRTIKTIWKEDAIFVLDSMSYIFSPEETLREYVKFQSKKIRSSILKKYQLASKKDIPIDGKNIIIFPLLKHYEMFLCKLVHLLEQSEVSEIRKINLNIQKLHKDIQLQIFSIYRYPLLNTSILEYLEGIARLEFTDENLNIICRINFHLMKYLSFIAMDDCTIIDKVYKKFEAYQEIYEKVYSDKILYLDYLYAFYDFHYRIYGCEFVELREQIIETYYNKGYENFSLDAVRRIVETFDLKHKDIIFLD